MIETPQKLVTHTIIITLAALASISAVAFSFYFVYVIRTVVLDLVIALVIAAALQPLVALMDRKGLGKIPASLIAILATLIIVGGIIAVITTPLVGETSRLINNVPQIVDQVTHNSQLAALNDKYHIINNLGFNESSVLSSIAGHGLPAFSIISGIIGGLTSVVVIIIFTFFILVDGPRAWYLLLQNFPSKRRARINATGEKMMRAVSGFVSGNLFISLIAGTVTLIVLLAFGVPYAFSLAILVALLDLIPLIGTALATIIVGLVALTQGVVVALIVIIILLGYQFTESHFIQPLVYSRSVQLSALLIIVATLVGAELAGVIGVLLAIPIAAIIQILIIDLFLYSAENT